MAHGVCGFRIARAAAVGTRDIDIGEELHVEADGAGAVADGTAQVAGVVGEVAGLVAVPFRVGRAGVEWIECNGKRIFEAVI